MIRAIIFFFTTVFIVTACTTPTNTPPVIETLPASTRVPSETPAGDLPEATTTPHAPKVTPSPTHIAATQPTSVSAETARPGGAIYFWDWWLKRYLVYEPTEGFTSLREVIPIDPHLDPKGSDDLHFASYHDRIAYVATPGIVQIWTASLNLQEGEILWQDEEQWLGNVSDMNSPLQTTSALQITWGPGDNSILLVHRRLDPTRIVLVNVETKDTHEFIGSCNDLVLPETNGRWGIGCQLQNHDGNEYYRVVEWDGSVREPGQHLGQKIEGVLDFAISPDGTQVIYATHDYLLYIMDSSGNREQVELAWSESVYYGLTVDEPISGFKWSHDNSKILVYGLDQQGSRCPNRTSVMDGTIFATSCWMMVESDSGEVIWWLKEDVFRASIGYDWNNVRTADDIDFSPDNEWIVMSLAEDTYNSSFLINPATDKVFTLGDFIMSPVSWGEK